MPEDDLEQISRLISEAKRLAESNREWAIVAYLLGLAAIELGKMADAPPEPPAPPGRPKS